MPTDIRAVIDTSSLVPFKLRRDLQQAAQVGLFTAIWSPWIIAELNRVLAWRWIKDRTGGDISTANEQQCSLAAKLMMDWLLPTFEVVLPLPPYPAAWDTLFDDWDQPIWAAAVISQANYVVSENTHDYPPRQADGRFVYQDVEYISAHAFLRLINDG